MLVAPVLQRIGEGFVSDAQKASYDLIPNEPLLVRSNPFEGTSKVSSSVISQGSNSIGVPPSTDLPQEGADEATLLLVSQDLRSSG